MTNPVDSASLSDLSQREVTVVAFMASLKNILFFGALGFGIYLLAEGQGWFGFVATWGGILLFAVLALEPLLAMLLTIAAVFNQPSLWLLPHFAISAFTALFYCWCVLAIYFEHYGGKA